MADAYEVITLSSSDEDSEPKVVTINKGSKENQKTKTSTSSLCSNSALSSSSSVISVLPKTECDKNDKVLSRKTVSASKPVSGNTADSKLQVQNLPSARLKRGQLSKTSSSSVNGGFVKTTVRESSSSKGSSQTICKESAPASHSNVAQKIDSLPSTDLTRNSRTVMSRNNERLQSFRNKDFNVPSLSSATSKPCQKSVLQVGEKPMHSNTSKASSNSTSSKTSTSTYHQRKSIEPQVVRSHVSVSNQHNVTGKPSEDSKSKHKDSSTNSKSKMVENYKTLPHSLLDSVKNGRISIITKNESESNATGRKNDTEVISPQLTILKSKKESYKFDDTSKKEPSPNTDSIASSLSIKSCNEKLTNTKKNLLEALKLGINSDSYSAGKLGNLGVVELIKKEPVKQLSTKSHKPSLKRVDAAKSKNDEPPSSTSSRMKAIPLPYKELNSTKTSNIATLNKKDPKAENQTLENKTSSNLLEVIPLSKVIEDETRAKSSFKSLKTGINHPKALPIAEDSTKTTKAGINSEPTDIEMLELNIKKSNSIISNKFSSDRKSKRIGSFSLKSEDSSSNLISLSKNVMDLATQEDRELLPSVILNKSIETGQKGERSSDVCENLMDKNSGMVKKDFKSPQRSPVHMAGNEKPLRQVTSPKLSLKRKRIDASDVGAIEEKLNINEEEPMETNFETTPRSNDSSDVSLKENVPFHQNKRQKTDRLSQNEKTFHELLEYCKTVMKDTEEEKMKVSKNICHRFESAQTDYLSSHEFSALLKTTKKQIEKDSARIFIPLNSLVQELKAHKKRKSSEPKAMPIAIEDAACENNSTKDNISNELADTDNRAKDSKRRLEKHVERLEKLLEKYDKAIKKLQEKELSLDELDDEESVYLLEDKYKRKFMRIWAELCKVKKRSVLAGRQMERRFCYEGTRFTPINQAIERKINKQKSTEKFPNYIEILTIVKNVNEKENLGLNEAYVTDLAKSVFKDVGAELKRRREYDDNELLSGYLPENFNPNEDPAEQDETLKNKLKESAELGSKRIAQVIDEYAEKQYLVPDDVEENVEDGEDDGKEPDDYSEEENNSDDAGVHLIEDADLQPESVEETNTYMSQKKENRSNEEKNNNCFPVKKESFSDPKRDDGFMESKGNAVEERKENYTVEKKEDTSLKKDAYDSEKEIFGMDDLPVTDSDSKSSEDVIILSRDPEKKNEEKPDSCPPTPDILLPQAKSTSEKNEDQTPMQIDETDYICEDVIHISDDNDSVELPSLNDLLKKHS